MIGWMAGRRNLVNHPKNIGAAVGDGSLPLCLLAIAARALVRGREKMLKRAEAALEVDEFQWAAEQS